MEFENIRGWFELLSYIAAVIGIPMAIIVYHREKIKERKIKEKEVLFTSHTLYVDYLKLCFENPELDIYNTSINNPEFTPKEKKELIAYEILFTYLESAFLYYEDQSDEIKQKRWQGWKDYIEDFSKQENFLKAWNITQGQWDEDFMKFVNGLIKS